MASSSEGFRQIKSLAMKPTPCWRLWVRRSGAVNTPGGSWRWRTPEHCDLVKLRGFLIMHMWTFSKSSTRISRSSQGGEEVGWSAPVPEKPREVAASRIIFN